MFLKLTIFWLLFLLSHCSGAVVDDSLLTAFETKQEVEILVTLVSTKEILRVIESESFVSRDSQSEKILIALRNHADIYQRTTKKLLQDNAVNYKSFWISNQIVIERADLSLVDLLRKLPEIESIKESIPIRLDPREIPRVTNRSSAPLQIAEWGIENIQAPLVWTIFNRKGKGVVVGGIDTGVRHTHEALRHNYIKEYGWMDPSESSLREPFDDSGHGTHTMGTIVGTGGIGVAPQAQWIACKGCLGKPLHCPQVHLLACSEYMLCPTGVPSTCKSPHIVSNSWGGFPQNDDWFNPVLRAWMATGIIPVFSIGNGGDLGCGTALSPGDQFHDLISVGATNEDDSLYSLSSRGPTIIPGIIKPFITAPGSDITSASHLGDNMHSTMSGTSQACPHVSGTIALLFSHAPLEKLTYTTLLTVLREGAEKNLPIPPQNCDGNSTTFPNNLFGHGRINAYDSFLMWRSKSKGNANIPTVIVLLPFVIWILYCYLLKLKLA